MTMPSKPGMSSASRAGDLRRLAACEQQNMLVEDEGAPLGGLDRGDDSIFVDVGRDSRGRMPNCWRSMSRAGEVEARHTHMAPP